MSGVGLERSFRHVLPDLFVGQQFAGVPVIRVPFERLLEGRFNSPTRSPAEFPPRLFGIQGQEVGFMLLRRLDEEIERRQSRLYGADDFFHRPG